MIGPLRPVGFGGAIALRFALLVAIGVAHADEADNPYNDPPPLQATHGIARCPAPRVTFGRACPAPPGPQIPPGGDWLPNAMTGTATRTRQVSRNATTAAITDLID